MKFKNGKEVDSLKCIKSMKKMPRNFRRTLWKRLKIEEGITWKEYIELETP
jgi:hypothetical protein